MNERDWKRLKALYKKHVRMARKIRWRVYKQPHGPAHGSGRRCPFWHVGGFPHRLPPFAFAPSGPCTREWLYASRLWERAGDEDPARVLKEFGWRVER